MRRYQGRKRNIISYLNVHHFVNYTDYFSYTETWIDLESEVENKYPSDGLQVGKIVVGSIEGSSGNYFFKGLLDGHPNIMLMTYEEFEIDLFWFCVRMAGKVADEIVADLRRCSARFGDWSNPNGSGHLRMRLSVDYLIY